jgi:YihY family inner membrane protein
MGDGFEKSWSLKEFGGEWVSLGRSFYLAFGDLGNSGAYSQAAAISYYAILSIFPFLMLLVVVSTRLLENPALSVQAVRLLGSYMPNGREFLSDILPTLQRISGTLGVVSLAGLAWSSMGLFAALRTALDDVGGDTTAPSPILQRWASFLAVLFSSLGLLLGLAVATLLSFLARLSFQVLSLGISQLNPMESDFPKLLLRPAGLAIQASTLALSAVITWVGIFLLLRHLPRRKPALRNTLVPALVVTLALDQLKGLLLLTVGSNKDLTMIQGPLAAAIAFMLWAYLSALVLLFGGAWTFRLGKERLQRSRVREIPPRPS